MGRLQNKVAIITGGSSGMGRAASILFASEGAKVVVADYVEEGGRETIRMISGAGREAIFIKADVSNSADVQNMVEMVIRTYGKLDILYNNAGIEQQPVVPLDQVSEESWDRVVNVNLKGVFLGMKYAIPHMLEKGGSIINTSSISGLVGTSCLSAYSASKGGVVLLTKSAALEYAKRNVRINCICPNAIQTPMFERARGGPVWEMKNKPYRVPPPMDRFGMPEEVVRVALFLASDESSYITGIALPVDGGVTAC
jgi:NAD(P)-dependent dehydrogenase (short-subunit alcohol dehydrogenase family)